MEVVHLIKKTKYVGLVAAALLAVAPAVAPAIQANVAQGNGIAQAADTAVPYFKVGDKQYKSGDTIDDLSQTYDTGTSADDIITAVLAQAKKQLVTSPVVTAYYKAQNGDTKTLAFDNAEFDRGQYNLSTLNSWAPTIFPSP